VPRTHLQPSDQGIHSRTARRESKFQRAFGVPRLGVPSGAGRLPVDRGYWVPRFPVLRARLRRGGLPAVHGGDLVSGGGRMDWGRGMPEVDFMILCDYVRSDGGVLHMIAGGVDQISAGDVPAAHNVGIGLRMSLTRAECDRPHDIELRWQDREGEPLLQIRAAFNAEYPIGLPTGWLAFGVLPLNVALPLPAYGVYSLELLIDGVSKKSIPVLVQRQENRTRGAATD
jgi:hypothetical protein